MIIGKEVPKERRSRKADVSCAKNRLETVEKKNADNPNAEAIRPVAEPR